MALIDELPFYSPMSSVHGVVKRFPRPQAMLAYTPFYSGSRDAVIFQLMVVRGNKRPWDLPWNKRRKPGKRRRV